MKVSCEWLSEFVSPLPPAEELATRLTRAGLEVEGLENPARPKQDPVRDPVLRES